MALNELLVELLLIDTIGKIRILDSTVTQIVLNKLKLII